MQVVTHLADAVLVERIERVLRRLHLIQGDRPPGAQGIQQALDFLLACVEAWLDALFEQGEHVVRSARPRLDERRP
ncbi:hypothetical protein D3C86_1200510 [compost metagenome]